MIFVKGEGEVEGAGEGGDRSESKVAWAWAWACWGTSTWGSRSDRATSPRRLSEQGFCQMQFPVQSTWGRQASRGLLRLGVSGCVGMYRFSREEETSQRRQSGIESLISVRTRFKYSLQERSECHRC